MHDQPEPTRQEDERAPEHQDEAEDQRGTAPADPELPEEPDNA